MKKLFSVWFCIFTTVILTTTCYGKELPNLQEDPFLLAKQQQHAVEIASSIREKFSDEKYGGMYIDEQNTLHVLIPRTKTKAMEFYDTDQENKTIFKYCDYSFNELENLADQLAEIMQELHLYAIEVNEHKNRVIAYQDVSENHNNYINKVSAQYTYLIKDPRLIIQYRVNTSELTAYTMQPGAHAVANGENVYVGGMSIKIGSVVKRIWNNNVNAAFIECNPDSAVTLSPTIAHTVYTITGNNTSFSTGQTIYKSGYATNWTSGKITSLVYWYSDKDTKIATKVVKTNANCAPGDSGGVVVMFNGNNRYAIGIVQSRDQETGSMNFCRVDTVLTQLGLTFTARP